MLIQGILHSANRFQLLTMDILKKDIFVEFNDLTFMKLLVV